jgi:N-acetyl-anhydromuramyl-L-alanine amidase AmpD
MGIVPQAWMPNCSMKRVILHWTAGKHKASSLDKAHYHILIEDDGTLVRGTHTILDNVSTGDDRYAAHTLKCNTGSIGVSVCCMEGAVERPFNSGNFPMTKTQWETMAQVVAELCEFYDIDVTPQTVLGHGEVTKELGIDQGGKWDPMVLPWDTKPSFTQVGDQFRDLVKSKITGKSDLREQPASITAVIQGKKFREAQIFNEKSCVKLRPVLDVFDWTLLHANEAGTIEIQTSSKDEPISLQVLLIDHANEVLENAKGTAEPQIIKQVEQFGFVKVSDLAKGLNLDVVWDGVTRTVTIG